MLPKCDYSGICTDVTKVENYEEAKNSPDLYVLHHLAECRFSSTELKEMDRYYNRPPEEFLFIEDMLHRESKVLHWGRKHKRQHNKRKPRKIEVIKHYVKRDSDAAVADEIRRIRENWARNGII